MYQPKDADSLRAAQEVLGDIQRSIQQLLDETHRPQTMLDERWNRAEVARHREQVQEYLARIDGLHSAILLCTMHSQLLKKQYNER